MNMDKFWMVWVTGTEGTHKRYEVEADARAEAERLARRHTGLPVYLLVSQSVVTTTLAPLQWSDTPAAGASAWRTSPRTLP